MYVSVVSLVYLLRDGYSARATLVWDSSSKHTLEIDLLLLYEIPHFLHYLDAASYINDLLVLIYQVPTVSN